MQIFNPFTNTNPLLVHAPGFDHTMPQWLQLVNTILPATKVGAIAAPDPSELTIVTFVHGAPSYVADEQMRLAGIPFVELSGYFQHVGPWLNSFKILYTYDFLKKVRTPYVLTIDAMDILLAENLHEIVPRFRRMNCDVLFGASVRPHPRDMLDVEPSETIWKYLNAGSVIGKTQQMLEFYGACAEMAKNTPETNYNNEQRIVKTVRRDFRNVKCDVDCEIFQTVGGFDYFLHGNTLRIDNIRQLLLVMATGEEIVGRAFPDRFLAEDGRIFEGSNYTDLLDIGYYSLKYYLF